MTACKNCRQPIADTGHGWRHTPTGIPYQWCRLTTAERAPDGTCQHCGNALQLVRVMPQRSDWLHTPTPEYGHVYRYCRLSEATPETPRTAIRLREKSA